MSDKVLIRNPYDSGDDGDVVWRWIGQFKSNNTVYEFPFMTFPDPDFADILACYACGIRKLKQPAPKQPYEIIDYWNLTHTSVIDGDVMREI
jgi:hypothetical protein